MRTTLDIDDDVLEAVKEIAKREKRTAGAVLSELARQAILGPERGPGSEGFREDQRKQLALDGWPTFPRREGEPRRIVTSAQVRRIQDELDLEDAKTHDFTKDGNAG